MKEESSLESSRMARMAATLEAHPLLSSGQTEPSASADESPLESTEDSSFGSKFLTILPTKATLPYFSDAPAPLMRLPVLVRLDLPNASHVRPREASQLAKSLAA